MVSFCFCAKFLTCACANLMSSRSRLATWPMARSTSPSLSLKEVGDHLSNFSDSARTAASPLASTSARIASTVWRTCASAALMAPASMPRLRWRAMAVSFPCYRRRRLVLDEATVLGKASRQEIAQRPAGRARLPAGQSSSGK